ncbi:MAG: hypothetical protein WCJ75_09300 [Desulfomonile sp.]
MNDEIRDKALENEAVDISPGIPVQSAETPTITGNEQEKSNALNNKRGRLITASLVATAILSVIALLVAGIFQLTARWMLVCPTDLPVNDPAPILWKDVVSEKVASRTLGVPEKLLTEVGLKVSGPKNSATEAGDENKP